METSILSSTKTILGLPNDYNVFDLEIITSINSAFVTLTQLGVLSSNGFSIDGPDPLWADLGVPEAHLASVKTYVQLKTKMVFDPPATSFHLEAMNRQIQELEWRLNVFREEALDD